MGRISKTSAMGTYLCQGCSPTVGEEVLAWINRYAIEQLECVVSGCSFSNGTFTYHTEDFVDHSTPISDRADTSNDYPSLLIFSDRFGVNVEEGAPFGQESQYGYDTLCEVLEALRRLALGETVDLPLLLHSGCGGGDHFYLSVTVPTLP